MAKRAKRDRSKKVDEEYAAIVESLRPFVKKGTFPAKRTPAALRKARRYFDAVHKARSQPTTFYRPRSEKRKREAAKQFGSPNLPGLTGAFVPVFDFGDSARVEKRGERFIVKTESRGRLLTRFQYIIPGNVVIGNREALRREVRAAIKEARRKGAVSMVFDFAGKDSKFRRSPKLENVEDELMDYLEGLLDNPDYENQERWISGLVFTTAKGQKQLPQRAGKSKRRRRTQSSRRIAQAKQDEKR